MIVKLKMIDGFGPAEGNSIGSGVCERPALLVYAGKFQSLDGEVEVTPEHLQRLVAAHNGSFAAFTKLENGEYPLKHYPPIQLDHSTSARDTVGRLIGDIYLGEYDVNGSKMDAGRIYPLG